MADAQFTWSKSMDTSSAPYSEQPYPYDSVSITGAPTITSRNAFKLFGMWQPTFFHGGNSWVDKIAGGWSLSGIWNWHSGFPWTPIVSVQSGSLYCWKLRLYQSASRRLSGRCGTQHQQQSLRANRRGSQRELPQWRRGVFLHADLHAVYLEPLPEPRFLSPRVFLAATLTLPGYKDVDLTLAKGFGLPKMPVLGENARIELRMDAFNVFNNLNLNPTSISSNIGSSNFGTISSALAARVLSLGARFSF